MIRHKRNDNEIFRRNRQINSDQIKIYKNFKTERKIPKTKRSNNDEQQIEESIFDIFQIKPEEQKKIFQPTTPSTVSEQDLSDIFGITPEKESKNDERIEESISDIFQIKPSNIIQHTTLSPISEQDIFGITERENLDDLIDEVYEKTDSIKIPKREESLDDLIDDIYEENESEKSREDHSKSEKYITEQINDIFGIGSLNLTVDNIDPDAIYPFDQVKHLLKTEEEENQSNQNQFKNDLNRSKQNQNKNEQNLPKHNQIQNQFNNQEKLLSIIKRQEPLVNPNQVPNFQNQMTQFENNFFNLYNQYVKNPSLLPIFMTHLNQNLGNHAPIDPQNPLFQNIRQNILNQQSNLGNIPNNFNLENFGRFTPGQVNNFPNFNSFNPNFGNQNQFLNPNRNPTNQNPEPNTSGIGILESRFAPHPKRTKRATTFGNGFQFSSSPSGNQYFYSYGDGNGFQGPSNFAQSFGSNGFEYFGNQGGSSSFSSSSSSPGFYFQGSPNLSPPGNFGNAQQFFYSSGTGSGNFNSVVPAPNQAYANAFGYSSRFPQTSSFSSSSSFQPSSIPTNPIASLLQPNFPRPPIVPIENPSIAQIIDKNLPRKNQKIQQYEKKEENQNSNGISEVIQDLFPDETTQQPTTTKAPLIDARFGFDDEDDEDEV